MNEALEFTYQYLGKFKGKGGFANDIDFDSFIKIFQTSGIGADFFSSSFSKIHGKSI